jgi:hypothetical protein
VRNEKHAFASCLSLCLAVAATTGATAPLLAATKAKTSAVAQPTYKVIYAGGSITTVKTGQKLPLTITADTITLGDLTIPVKTVTALDLTQDKHHRIGTGIALSVVTLGAGIPVMLSKSTKDFISVTYQGGGVDFQADKREYRGILAQLQGVTGLTATAPAPPK